MLLMIELKTVGLRTEKERMVKVFYDNKEVGTLPTRSDR